MCNKLFCVNKAFQVVIFSFFLFFLILNYLFRKVSFVWEDKKTENVPAGLTAFVYS